MASGFFAGILTAIPTAILALDAAVGIAWSNIHGGASDVTLAIQLLAAIALPFGSGFFAAWAMNRCQNPGTKPLASGRARAAHLKGNRGFPQTERAELDDIDGLDYAEGVMSSSTAREHVFTFEEYVRVAEGSPVRLEFWDGVILDMSGGTPRHSAICSNIIAILRSQLRGGHCRPYDANLKVRSTVVNRATYADAAVVCGPLEMDPADRTGQTVLNPAVLFEVLSPSTEADDRGPKLDCYRTIASVMAVVHIAQDERRVTIHERADGGWSQAIHTSGTADLPSIGCTLPLDEIYADLPD